MSARIGQFFVYLGLIALVIFLATAQATRPAFSYLCGGALSLLFGIFLISRIKSTPTDAGRFRLLRGSGKKSKDKGSSKSR